MKRIAGTPPTGNFFQMEIREFTSGTGGGLSQTNHTPTTVWQRASHTRVLTDATVTNAQPTLRFSFANATAYDFTLRLALPQLEQGPFATSPVLPGEGTTVASTRAADDVVAGLGSWFRPDAGTLAVEAVLLNGVQANLPLLSLNDGATSNLDNNLCLRVNAAGTQVVSVLRVATVQTTSPGITPLNPTTVLKAAVAWDVTSYQCAVDGSVGSSVAVAIPSGLVSHLAIGQQPGASMYANAEIANLTYYPARLPSSALQTLTT